MYNYLKMMGYVNNHRTIDLFHFDCMVNQLSLLRIPGEFICIHDRSMLIWYALYHVVQEPFDTSLQFFVTEKKLGSERACLYS